MWRLPVSIMTGGKSAQYGMTSSHTMPVIRRGHVCTGGAIVLKPKPLPPVDCFATSGSKSPVTGHSAVECPERLPSISVN